VRQPEVAVGVSGIAGYMNQADINSITGSIARKTSSRRIHIHLITHYISPPDRLSSLLLLHPTPIRNYVPFDPLTTATTARGSRSKTGEENNIQSAPTKLEV